ncbi:MAG TPA: XdhC family protein, partial [Methylomirabilota bacterium]|nr:XdhC family protein [Methylomirabilota bacterium]
MSELLALAAELQRRGESFALATVVRCEAPTSAKPGAKALVRQDGRVVGWVGGACAEPVVVREALHALADGRPRLIGLLGDGARGPGRTSGMVEYPMTCHSGGTLEIYVEPYLAKPLLVLIGHGPVLEALATFGRATEYSVHTLDARQAANMLQSSPIARRAAVVVATHADADEDALVHVLMTDARYVSLVASRRRAAAITERLQQRGVPLEHLARLKAPAGLDIGAESPHEIAVSILAEIIQHRRTAKPEPPVESTAREAEAIDPVCGMTVDIASAAYRSERAGRIV